MPTTSSGAGCMAASVAGSTSPSTGRSRLPARMWMKSISPITVTALSGMPSSSQVSRRGALDGRFPRPRACRRGSTLARLPDAGGACLVQAVFAVLEKIRGPARRSPLAHQRGRMRRVVARRGEISMIGPPSVKSGACPHCFYRCVVVSQSGLRKTSPPCGGDAQCAVDPQQLHPQPPLLPPQQPLPQPLPQNRNSRMMAMMIQQQLLPPPKQEF